MIALGLDVGTSSIKAALFDETGVEIGHGRAATPWRAVPTGAELDPDALLDATLEAAAAAVAVLGPGETVVGVGVASMAETGVLVDAHARPVVPSIAWHDTRGADEAAGIAAQLPDFGERSGLPATPLCTLAKYAWMRTHWPDAARGRRWLNVADWLVHGLGGEPANESSLASRTGFFDLHTRAPSDAALAFADAPAGLVGEHAPAGTPLGRAGDALPALQGAALAVGGHDHLAAVVGAGATGAADVLDSCGTAEALLRTTAPLPPAVVAAAVADGFTVGWHAVTGRHALEGAIWSGETLQAVLDLLGVDAHARDALELAALTADPGPLALHGLSADALTITGLRPGVAPGALYRAALERIGDEGAAVLARMEAIAGPAQRLVVTGGWAEGVAACAVKARHLGSFEHVRSSFAGCRGAALAAFRAAQA